MHFNRELYCSAAATSWTGTHIGSGIADGGLTLSATAQGLRFIKDEKRLKKYQEMKIMSWIPQISIKS